LIQTNAQFTFPGTVFGFCNMFLSLDGILAPFIAGKCRTHTDSLRRVFNQIDPIINPKCSCIFFGPVTGEILEYCSDVRGGWNAVFYMCAVVYLIGAVLFVWLADSTPQKWAMATYEPEVNLTLPASCIPTGSCTQLSSAEVVPDNGDDDVVPSIRF
jgi:hypothetical protein